MGYKINSIQYNNLEQQEKAFLDTKLIQQYKSKYNEYYFQERVIDTFESIGITFLKELSVDYDTVRNNLYIDAMIDNKNINLMEFIRSMNIYCIINNQEERELMSALDDPEFNIQIKYKYKGAYNYCDVQSVNLTVEEVLSDKTIDFLNEVFDLLQSEFKENAKMLNDPDTILDKWKDKDFEFEITDDFNKERELYGTM